VVMMVLGNGRFHWARPGSGFIITTTTTAIHGEKACIWKQKTILD